VTRPKLNFKTESHAWSRFEGHIEEVQKTLKNSQKISQGSRDRAKRGQKWLLKALQAERLEIEQRSWWEVVGRDEEVLEKL